ncbi:MAG TPA: ABC transporter permease [Ktedonobacterales bacterium]|jgi:ABC-2 type transport system permease protein|nr:ABC transporter permease [Ktedonobacterales bacterium]
MKGYLRLEMLRTLRDPLYICLAVGAPIGFYLLFTTIFGGQPPAPGQLSTLLVQMIAMSVYGGMWACLLATGPRIAAERGSGWLRNLRLLPIAPWATLAARMIAALVFALPAILLVCVTAVIAHGVQLSVGQWLAVIGLVWVGVWPFALLGIAIGYSTSAEASFGVTFGLYTTLAALGGLWVPLAIFPSQLQTIGKALPSYQAANLGWRVANGQAITVTSVVTLAVWTLIFLLLATLFSARPWRMRAA